MQKEYIVGLVVRRLLVNYITRPQFPSNIASYAIIAEDSHPGVLQRVGSAAGNVVVKFINLCKRFKSQAFIDILHFSTNVLSSLVYIICSVIHIFPLFERKTIIANPFGLEFKSVLENILFFPSFMFIVAHFQVMAQKSILDF